MNGDGSIFSKLLIEYPILNDSEPLNIPSLTIINNY